MSHALAMPEPRYKIAVFDRGQRCFSVSDPTYSWDQVLDIVRRYRQAKLDLTDVQVQDAQWTEWIMSDITYERTL